MSNISYNWLKVVPELEIQALRWKGWQLRDGVGGDDLVCDANAVCMMQYYADPWDTAAETHVNEVYTDEAA